jgi:hypothetical protein
MRATNLGLMDQQSLVHVNLYYNIILVHCLIFIICELFTVILLIMEYPFVTTSAMSQDPTKQWNFQL